MTRLASLLLLFVFAAPSSLRAQDSLREAVFGPDEEESAEGSEEGAETEEEDQADSESDEPAPPSNASAIALTEVGRRIEETFQHIQSLTPTLRRQANILQIRRTAPNFVAYVAELADDPALEHLDRLHAGPLHDMEHEWRSARATLLEWQEELELRTGALTEARVELRELEGRWTRTREVHEEELAESQLARIAELLRGIRRSARRIDLRLDEVLQLQGELSDQGLLIARQVSRIEAAQARARQRRGRRDHRPLWKGWSRLDQASDAASPSVMWHEHIATIEAFAYAQKKPMMVHSALFLLVLIGFVWLRRRLASKATFEGDALSPQRALRAHPVAAAVLLSSMVGPGLYGYVPIALVGAGLILCAPPIVLLVRAMMPDAGKAIAGLVLLTILSVPISLGLVAENWKRYYALVLLIGAVVFTTRLWVMHRRPSPSGASPKRVVSLRAARTLLRLALIPVAMALYFLFSGFTDRGVLWTTGTLWVIEQALGLAVAVELVVSLMGLALRLPSARVSLMVRTHRRALAHVLRRVLRLLALVALIASALASFDLLDPTLASSREALGRTFEFGSIEISAGSVLAFFGMLVGTFVVMRVVHVLLEFELLPRFQLEQGISSAISLTASYLLVGIGVVLAFAAAGVGPERLALLGGALGVGIGFGLQNVVSNFVSGLILVAERPIQVGDIIEVDHDLVGTVRRIGIRSSTVHSLDGADVIVPNSNLVSGQLINWTLGDRSRRLDLVVGAAYRHDPKDVMKLLREVVTRQPMLLHDPPSEVLCTEFGDSSIEYTVRAWASGYLEAIEAKSQLAAAVHEAFAGAGIEIPFPQQDLHIKEGGLVRTELSAESKEAESDPDTDA